MDAVVSSLPPLGVVLRAANQDTMIAGGNHTSVSCRVSGKGGVVGNFGLVPFNEPHPLSLALLDSSPTGEPRGKAGVNQAFSSKCMDRDLNRVSITCLAVARMSTWAT